MAGYKSPPFVLPLAVKKTEKPSPQGRFSPAVTPQGRSAGYSGDATKTQSTNTVKKGRHAELV